MKRGWPALVAAAVLLSAPQAFASRTASTRTDLLASSALQPITATPVLTPTYAPQGFALRLDVDPHPATFALFPDLAPASERVEPEKLASGVASWELTPNLQRIQIFATDSRWCREFLGPIDSPNLYQAFGLDPMNMTDPYGLCIFGLPCPETLRSVGGFIVGVGEGLAATAVGVVTAPVAIPLGQLQQGMRGTQRVFEGYGEDGLSGAFAAGAAVQEEMARDSGEQLLSMVPGVNTYRLASKVVETYETEGAYAGGRQVGKATFSLGLDVTTVWAATKATQAARRPATSPAPEALVADFNEVSPGLKNQWKRAGQKGGPARPYQSIDPPMDAPPVRVEPITIEQVQDLRSGLKPRGVDVEYHHRRGVPMGEGGVMDELPFAGHRGKGVHGLRHDLSQPTRLTPAQRKIEIRLHRIQRGAEYILPGEGI